MSSQTKTVAKLLEDIQRHERENPGDPNWRYRRLEYLIQIGRLEGEFERLVKQLFPGKGNTMSGAAPALQGCEHLHLPSVHVRTEGDTGYDYEEDLFVFGRAGRRIRIKRIVHLVAIEGGMVMLTLCSPPRHDSSG